MARHANATSFKPGDRANPKGRPPGIKEALPRGAFKAAYDRVLAKDPQLLDTVIRAGKEIGADAEHDTRPVIFKFFTNLNPMALAPRSLPGRTRKGGRPASRRPCRAARSRRPTIACWPRNPCCSIR
jgi:hypothetical protein